MEKEERGREREKERRAREKQHYVFARSNLTQEIVILGQVHH